MKSMYEIIKHQNGEAFAKAIRQFDSGIFDIPNLPTIVRYAGRDATKILPFLEGLKMHSTGKEGVFIDPFKLLDEAGYKAFYVDSLEKQNSIKKYFDLDEELCTFDDQERFKKYHIIHCVKKNVDEIRRSNFLHPKREDAYGTSVISIQMSKKGGFIKITNRYNHTVENPDNTFHSNPDNIIQGLTYAFERYFHIDFGRTVEVPNGFVFFNNQLFKINFERQNVFFGDGFYIKEGKIFHLNKDYEILADTYIINLKNRTITSPVKVSERILTALKNEVVDKKLSVQKDGKRHIIYMDESPFMVVKENRIQELCFERMTEFYLPIERLGILKKLTFKNLKKVGANFLLGCWNISELDMPDLIMAGNSFCRYSHVSSLNAPRLIKVGDYSLSSTAFKELNLPMLKIIGESSLSQNEQLENLSLENLGTVAPKCISSNPCLKKVHMPLVRTIKTASFLNNYSLEQVYFPVLNQIEKNCFKNLGMLSLFVAPKLETYDIFGFVGRMILKSKTIDTRNVNEPLKPSYQDCLNMYCISKTNLAARTYGEMLARRQHV